MRAPLAAWAAALAVLWLAAASSGASPFSSSTWVHWDSGHYLAIATHGYDLHRCKPRELPRPETWCGNTAWFPLYPWTIRAVHALDVPAAWAGIAISWFFAAIALVLLWRTFPMPLLGLAYAAYAPGFVYNFAVFPLSLFVAATIAYLAALRRRRWGRGGAAAFAAALAYPIGVIVLPVVSLLYVARATTRVAPTAITALPPLLAFGVVVLDQRLEVGRWRAFFDVQKSYGHGIHDPFTTTWNYATVPFRGSPFTWGAAPYWQTLVVTAILVLVVVRRRDVLLLLYAVVAWALPLMQANVSVWRSEDALVPIAPLVGRLPRWLAAACVLAVVAVGFATAKLFFQGALV